MGSVPARVAAQEPENARDRQGLADEVHRDAFREDVLEGEHRIGGRQGNGNHDAECEGESLPSPRG